MNSFKVDGKIKTAPILSTSAKGVKYTRFSILNEEEKSKTRFNVIAFGDVAEKMSKELDVNDIVVMECTITQSKYEKDGETKYSFTFNATDYSLCEKASTDCDLPMDDIE